MTFKPNFPVATQTFSVVPRAQPAPQLNPLTALVVRIARSSGERAVALRTVQLQMAGRMHLIEQQIVADVAQQTGRIVTAATATVDRFSRQALELGGRSIHAHNEEQFGRMNEMLDSVDQRLRMVDLEAGSGHVSEETAAFKRQLLTSWRQTEYEVTQQLCSAGTQQIALITAGAVNAVRAVSRPLYDAGGPGDDVS
jgi:hypothetical protein